MENLQEKIARVLSESIHVVDYDETWPEKFTSEKNHLEQALPEGIIRRIEHFGSTAIPGMPAKPVVDLIVEVSSLDEVKAKVVPVLEKQGYDYFWRPMRGEGEKPFYAWFIKRDKDGNRTHHIHMVEKAGFEEFWDRLLFRDYLIETPELAKVYAELKQRLSGNFVRDRVAYTEGKTDFINRVTQMAREHYGAA